MKPHVRALACLSLLVAGVTATAFATQIAYLTPRELGQQSELVFRGKVVSVNSYWNDKHTKIFTRTRVAVDETYKGSSWAVVDVVQLGGTVGKVKVTVQGALQWNVGEEVLLFAEPYDTGSFQVSGFSQGKFGIKRNARTGTAYVQAPQAEGVTLLGAPSVQGLIQTSGTERVPLEAFVNQALGRR